MKRYVCLYLVNWPIQRMIARRPELKRKHILLFRRDSRRGQLVAAASPLALRDGVYPDMPLSEAKSLLKRTTQAARPVNQRQPVGLTHPSTPSTPNTTPEHGSKIF